MNSRMSGRIYVFIKEVTKRLYQTYYSEGPLNVSSEKKLNFGLASSKASEVVRETEILQLYLDTFSGIIHKENTVHFLEIFLLLMK